MKENMPKIQSPAIILVGAQLGENIGTVARAMLNFGLTICALCGRAQTGR